MYNYDVLGVPVARIEEKHKDEEQGIIICDLFAEDGRLLAENRCFYFAGENENMPKMIEEKPND